MSLGITFRTAMAGILLGMPFGTASAQADEKPAVEKKNELDLRIEKIKGEFNEARKIIEKMKQDGLPKEVIDSEGEKLSNEVANELIKLNEETLGKKMTEEEKDETLLHILLILSVFSGCAVGAILSIPKCLQVERRINKLLEDITKLQSSPKNNDDMKET